jgi:hypothetical protein
MNMLRTRLFITLVVTAVAVAVLDVGSGLASSRAPRGDAVVQVTKAQRPAIGPLSGEPDAGGGNLPPPKSTQSAPGRSSSDVVDTWLDELLARWLASLRHLRGF